MASTDFQLVIQAGIQHRIHGVGLLTTLVVPHHLTGTKKRFNAAARLNQIEFASLKAPDFLGGWSAAQRVDSLTYTSFLPDRALLPGLLARLARGAVVRADIAQDFLASHRLSEGPLATSCDSHSRRS